MKSSSIKHIFKTVLLLLIFSFILDKLAFLTLNKISDTVYAGQSIGKLNHYLKIKDSTDLVIYGSSRANHNVDPKKLNSSSFNMGMDGRMMAYSATLVKLLPENKNQTVLLHIDPENAFNTNYKGNDISALNSKYNRNEDIKNEIDNIDQNNFLQNIYWSLSYNGKVLGIIKNYFKPKYDYSTYSGYDPIKVSDEQRKIFDKKLKNREVEECSNSYQLNSLYNRYIEELKAFCDENNKELVLFTSPRFLDDCKTDNIELQQVLTSKKIKYYDLTDFFKENNSMEFWKDETHLSDKGAEMFTIGIKNILTEDGRKPHIVYEQ